MNDHDKRRFDSTVSSSTSAAVREVVIVDSSCDHYGDFVQSARRGEMSLHFCVSGRSAVRMARRFCADVWLVAAELSDMSGFDLLDMITPHVLQGDVDPLRSGARISLDRIGSESRSGVFIVADSYRVEDEQRALASGVAGYLVRPVSLDAFRGRPPAADAAAPSVDSTCS